MTVTNYGSNMSTSSDDDAKGSDERRDGGYACDEVIEKLTEKSLRFQYLAAGIAGLANASDAVEVLCLSFILGQVDGITDAEKGILSATVFLGMLVGGLLAGFAGDRFGRKPLLMVSLTINAIFCALSGALPYWQWLATCRVIAGVGVGGSIPTLFTLFVEYLPRHNRGYFISLVAWFWMWGSIVAAGTGWIMIGYLGLSWRLFTLACAVPATTACALVMAFLPESPRYLYSQGRVVKCVKSLEVMARWNRVSGAEVDISGAILKQSDDLAEKGAAFSGNTRRPTASAGVRSFFREFCSTSFRPAILLSIIWFTVSFGWYGLNVWIPTLFDATGLDLDPYQDSFLVAAANLPGNIMAALLIDRVGRKSLLAGTLVAACLCAIGFAFSTGSEAAVVTAACLMNAVSVGTWNVLDALSVEHFPTPLRTSAMGVLSASGRLGSIAGQLVMASLVHVSIPALLGIAAGLLLLGAGAAVALPARTAMDDEQANAGAGAHSVKESEKTRLTGAGSYAGVSGTDLETLPDGEMLNIDDDSSTTASEGR